MEKGALVIEKAKEEMPPSGLGIAPSVLIMVGFGLYTIGRFIITLLGR